MTESNQANDPAWEGLNLPVLTDVVDDMAAPESAAAPEAGIEIPEFDFSSELDLMAAELTTASPGGAPLDIPELQLEELLGDDAPPGEAAREPALDFGMLPSLDLDVPAGDEAGGTEAFDFSLQPRAETASEADGLAALMARADVQQAVTPEEAAARASFAALDDAALDQLASQLSAEPAPESPPVDEPAGLAWADVVAAVNNGAAEPAEASMDDAETEPALSSEADAGMGLVDELEHLPWPSVVDEAAPVPESAPSAQAEPDAPRFLSIPLDSLPSGVLGGGMGLEPPPPPVDDLAWLSTLQGAAPQTPLATAPAAPTLDQLLQQAEATLSRLPGQSAGEDAEPLAPETPAAAFAFEAAQDMPQAEAVSPDIEPTPEVAAVETALEPAASVELAAFEAEPELSQVAGQLPVVEPTSEVVVVETGLEPAAPVEAFAFEAAQDMPQAETLSSVVEPTPEIAAAEAALEQAAPVELAAFEAEPELPQVEAVLPDIEPTPEVAAVETGLEPAAPVEAFAFEAAQDMSQVAAQLPVVEPTSEVAAVEAALEPAAPVELAAFEAEPELPQVAAQLPVVEPTSEVAAVETALELAASVELAAFEAEPELPQAWAVSPDIEPTPDVAAVEAALKPAAPVELAAVEAEPQVAAVELAHPLSDEASAEPALPILHEEAESETVAAAMQAAAGPLVADAPLVASAPDLIAEDKGGVAVVKVASMAAAGSGAHGLPLEQLDEQALFDALYQQMLPRMKVELSLWLQDAIELQTRQMLSGMMHQLKEDYEMLFGDALKESLKQAMERLAKQDKDEE
ncbi:hypothetical protein CEK28_05495 [Xenophilus sp. AP218F]|nr:hypothetical protein CEK28_05495 [Xenophilus sp. AP218F]